MIIVCSYCKKETDLPNGKVNRAKKQNLNIYCNRKCAGLGRRSNKSLEQKKTEKRLYDFNRLNGKDRKKILQQKKDYAKTKKGRLQQKKQRLIKKENGYTNNYNKQPEQRKKEKIRRYKRLFGKDYLNNNKKCLVCEETKFIIEFEHAPIFPDNRYYLCKQCEKLQNKEYGCTTKNTITAMIMRPYTNLTRYDVAKHPYLIEANKILILLKQAVK